MLCQSVLTLWWRDMGLFVIKFPFIQDHVSKVFDGIWCMFFMRVLVQVLGTFKLISCSMEFSCINHEVFGHLLLSHEAKYQV